jgi:glycosyltransferase involved in cell wall biosynthesis
MRCILTVNFSPWSRYSGGGQRSTHNLARALARRGHSVHVVYTKPPWERVQLPDALPYEVVWAALPALRSQSNALLRPSTPWFVARAVRRLLASAGPAIVHGNGEEAALVPELRPRARRFGFVMTPRYPALPAAFTEGHVQRSRTVRAILALTHAKYVLLGRALAGADFVCPTSRYAASLVERAYPIDPAKLRVIPNGVSDEFLSAPAVPAAALAPQAMQPCAAQAQVPFAIYFGRLAREKGVHTLLDALAQSGPEPEMFVFAGRGPELDALRAQARTLGLAHRVRFLTWLDARALADLVRKASFAVLPSLEESFGNTMAEAMALAVPVISTTAGSIPELIEGGRTGVLVPPGDARALASAIRGLAHDVERRRELGQAGQARVRPELSWDSVAAKFEDVYASALAAAK